MHQAASPAATPTFADRVTVATASASIDTAVIGTSHPKVTPTAAPESADATIPSTASRANTASARTSSTIRSLTAVLHDSSHAGSIPGPYAYAIPAPASAGATSATSGSPAPSSV